MESHTPIWKKVLQNIKTSKRRGKTSQNIQYFITLGILAIAGLLFVVNSAFIVGWDFRNNLWGPARLLTLHKSPYQINNLFEIANAVWMPMIIGALFPLGWLPLQQANNLWFLVSFLCLPLIVWISSGFRHLPITSLAGSIILCIVFPPLSTHFLLGQISLLITLLLLLVVTKENEMPLFLSAFLTAIALAKPQLAILVLPGLIFSKVKHAGFRETIKFATLLSITILSLTIPLFVAFPNWFPDFLIQVQRNPSWAHPSSLNILKAVTPKFGDEIWAALAISIFCLNIWVWNIKQKQEAVFWSLALTPLITPYIWTWDFVMALPLLLFSILRNRSKAATMLLYIGYITICFVIFLMRVRGAVSDFVYWWTPWCFVALVLISRYVETKTTSLWMEETEQAS